MSFSAMCQALFLGKMRHPEQCHILMLSAYFDESMTPIVMAGGGYLASVQQWKRFDADWRGLLRRAGIPDGTPFHMTDFESRAPGSPYEHWGDSKRKKFMQDAVGIIRRRAALGLLCAVELDAYNDLIVKPIRAAGGAGAPEASFAPYSFCIGSCLKFIEEWCNEKDLHEPISYFFESGAPHSGHLGNVLNHVMADPVKKKRYRMHTWSFGTKLDHIPFQAADILAYEGSKHYTKEKKTGKAQIRPSFRGLLDGAHTRGIYWQRPNMVRYFRHLDHRREERFQAGDFSSLDERVLKWLERQSRRNVGRAIIEP